ncbi:MAG: hypothetical protein BGO27_06800 [Alphaproteobacteria bacterium 33-17]|mgnify:CR=1 FL=1|nr:MAG: hypothetical protein BGO27_06800 [Alphaproteobacteria bacterium 33-17]
MRDSVKKILNRYGFDGAVLMSDNFEERSWFDADIAYPIASVSKMFAAVVAYKVTGKYKVPLKTQANVFLNRQDFPDNITIKDLLLHTSGLNLYTDFTKHEDNSLRLRNLPKQEFYEKIIPRDPKEKKFEYNNANYIVLEDVLEAITNKKFKYQDLLQEMVINPCRLNNTGIVEYTQHESEYWVTGYDVKGQKASSTHYSWLGAGAGMYSSLSDLASFAKSLMDQRLMPKDSLEYMFKDRGNNYGLGCTIKEIDGTKVIYHEGGIPGFSTMLMIEPESRKILIMLSNKEFPKIEKVALEAFESMLNVDKFSWRSHSGKLEMALGK